MSMLPVPELMVVELVEAVEPMVTVLAAVPPVPKLRAWAPVPVPMEMVPV